MTNRLFVTLGLAAALLIAATGCDLLGGEEDGGEKSPELTGKLVFAAETGEHQDTQIFTMNADGTERKQLTFDNSDERDFFAMSPAWSPDGEKIVFASNREAAYSGRALWVMNADGSGTRLMKKYPDYPFPRQGDFPAWSPDGKKIAFYYCRNCETGGRNYEIFVFDLEADTTRRLTHHLLQDRRPTWSPDGEQIAFISGRDHPGEPGTDLYVMDADGSNVKRLTQTGKVGLPAWSPDGNKIAFKERRGRSHPTRDLFIYRIKSKTLQNILTMKRIGGPAWHLDSEHLLVPGVTSRDEANLKFINLKGEVISTVKLSGEIFQLDWFVEAKK